MAGSFVQLKLEFQQSQHDHRDRMYAYPIIDAYVACNSKSIPAFTKRIYELKLSQPVT